MNKNYKNTKTLINEMHSMLNTKPKRMLTIESLVFGEDGDEMMGDIDGLQDENNQQPDENPVVMNDKQNPLDEDPAITKLITGIRVQTLQGLTKLAQNPESAQYELLKKIFLLIDKAVEDKVDVEK